MNNAENIHRVLERVAENNGVTVEEVTQSMNDAILDAISRCCRENDQQGLALWNAIPCAGKIPNAQEVIAFLGKRVLGMLE